MSVINRYFLAANGFSGFRCHFSRLLSSAEIKKLYIIKGGSGVGKSTLMRRVSSHFSDMGFSVEEILCSSDPNSLDGVVIRSEHGTIVLIDGTAPHEYDMKYPAMRDITVDLSKHLDEEAIEKKSDSITDLIKKKKRCYDSAYKNLRLAGDSYSILADTARLYADSEKIESLAKSLLPEKSRTAKVESKLYSAFCKNGVISLDTKDEKYETVYYFDRGYKTHILFSALFEKAKNRCSKITLFTSPFSDEIIDGFSVDGAILFKACDSAPTYKSDCYFEKFDQSDIDITDSCEKIFEISIESARRSLCRASENHSELEKIYGAHMNFEKNTALCSRLIAKIESEV